MAKPTDNLKINGERLWDSIHEIAKIGPGVRGGSNRQTLTDADGEGRRVRGSRRGKGTRRRKKVSWVFCLARALACDQGLVVSSYLETWIECVGADVVDVIGTGLRRSKEGGKALFLPSLSPPSLSRSLCPPLKARPSPSY